MTLKQLIYFREIVKYKHFTKAANALYTSQSTLSHAIMELEDELGVELFIRSNGKKVEVSSYGLAFLEHVQKILEDIDTATDAIQEMRAPTSGVVNVAYSFVNGFSLIPRAIRALREDEVGTNIITREIINHGERKIESELRDGSLDIAFTAAARFLDLESLPIATQTLQVMIPRSNPLSEQDSVSLQDLEDESIIIYNRGNHMHRWILKMFESEGILPNIEMFCDDWALQMTEVAIGKGIAISQPLPYDSELVAAVKLDHPMSRRTIYMHWSESNARKPAVKYSIEFYRSYFENLNGGPIQPSVFISSSQ